MRKEYYIENREAIIARQKAYYHANKDAISAKRNSEYQKAWREANKGMVLTKEKEYRAANKEKIRLKNQEWYKRNRDAICARAKAWRDDNEEKMRAYRQSERGKSVRNALFAKRRAAELQRTPSWLTEADWAKIKRVYERAQQKTKDSGERWVVDHVIPLMGAVVSGLHVPANLRVIKATTNSRKSNTFDLEKEWALT